MDTALNPSIIGDMFLPSISRSKNSSNNENNNTENKNRPNLVSEESHLYSSENVVSKNRLRDENACSNLIQSGFLEGVYPGAVLHIGRVNEVGTEKLFCESIGDKWSLQEGVGSPLKMTNDTVFDVASLTSGLITTTILMKLIDEQKIRLEDRVSKFISGFGVLGKSHITVEQLILTHQDYQAGNPFYDEIIKKDSDFKAGVLSAKGAKDYILNRIFKNPS